MSPPSHDTIWPPEQIQVMAKRAVASVGGPIGFEAIGPKFRRAVIAAAAWDAVRTGAMTGPITITQEQMNAIETALRRAAGIPEGDD